MADTQLSNEDAQNLIQQLVGWAKQGGGNSTSAYIGSNGTNVNQVASPGMAADAATSIAGGQQGNGGNMAGGNSGPQPQLSPSQQINMDAATKMLKKNADMHAANTPIPILQNHVDTLGGTNAPANIQIPTGKPAAQPTQTQPQVQVPTGNPQGYNRSRPNVQVPTGQTQNTQRVTQNPSMYMKDPYKVPAGVNPAPQQNAPAPIQATAEPDQTQANYKQANLLLSQQALREAQPRTWLQSFQDNFLKMSGGVTQADRLANLATGQKIAGGEQLQPKDIATLTSDQWRAGLDATKTSLTAEAQNLSNLIDLHGKLEQTKGKWNQIWGNPSEDQKKVVGRINESYKNIGNLVNNVQTLTNQAPQFSGGGVNSQASNIDSKLQNGVDPAALAEARKRGLMK